MKILVTGNLGYIGPVLGRSIKEYFQNSFLSGCDTGLFSTCINNYSSRLGDTYYDNQLFIDVRDLNEDIIKNYDYVVCLAAISNDPIGKDFEVATNLINFESTIRLANLCVKNGIKKFIFASSCSIYGSASDYPRIEDDEKNPLTAYSKSKVAVEEKLRKDFGNSSMEIFCLRFSTACGCSDRLRLDLVLNDFVASGIKYGEISILSDGNPLRPLIDVKDMSKAIIWALKYKDMNLNLQNPKNIICINIGCNEWNFKVIDLARKVKEQLPKTEITINENASPDKRSYRVNFDLFKSLGGEFYPKTNINTTINELIEQIKRIDFTTSNFRDSNFIRLNHLRNLKNQKIIDDKLLWLK